MEMRQEMSESYSLDKVVALETAIEDRKQMLEAKRSEKDDLQAWFAWTDWELAQFNRNGEYDDKVHKLATEYWDAVKEHRWIYYETNDKQKTLVEKHDKVVQLDKACIRMKEVIDNRVQLEKIN